MPLSQSVAVIKHAWFHDCHRQHGYPCCFAYGGTIAPGNLNGKDIDLVSVLKESENGTTVT